MSDHDDYLWAKTGTGDATVLEMERLLSRHAYRPRAWRARPAARNRRRRIAMAAAATLVVCMLSAIAWFQHRLTWPAGEPWRIVATEGRVRVESGAVDGWLATGSEIATGADGAASIDIARIGKLQLGPHTRLRLEQTRSGRHRVRLVEGRMHARVWAPPMHFGVLLPGVEALDLGCEFTVRSDADGNGELGVSSGWVLLDAGADEVLVPAGASVSIRGDRAGTPHDNGASAAFLAALRAIDGAGAAISATNARLRELADAARPRDAISLMSLLQRHPQLARSPVYARLREVLPDAPAVDRDAILRRDPGALDAWWDALPYPRVKRWWLQWPDALPARPAQAAPAGIAQATGLQRVPILGACEGCDAVFDGAPDTIASTARIAPRDEPGEPMVLSGRVLDAAGIPQAGVIVYAYQTDRGGVYPPPPPAARLGESARRHGRLRAWVRTDAAGRYRFDTIRPGSYPDADIPQHIHMHVVEPGCSTYYIDDVMFRDDPRLTPAQERRLAHGIGGNGVVAPTLRDGAWQVERDIVLGAGVTGYRPCRATR